MRFYYFNKKNSRHGILELHEENCGHGTTEGEQIPLGLFVNHAMALSAARKRGYGKMRGCTHCCPV